MSSSETEDSTSIRDGNEEFDFSENEEDYNVVYAQVGAYQDEPLALPGAEDDGQEDNSDAGDPDQLSLATLEARFERRTPLNQWLAWMIILNLLNVQDTTAGSIEAARKLEGILKTYNKKLRPFADGPPINVSVQIAVVAFGPVDEKSFTFKIDIFLRQWWTDSRLEPLGNDSLNYNGDPSQIIWVVDTYLPNARKTESHKGLTVNTRTKLGPHGKVFVSTRLTAVCSCQMDLTLYPIDVQECSLIMESYSYHGEDVHLRWKESDVAIEFVPGSLQLSGYKVTDVRKEYILRRYTTYTQETFPLLKATFKVERTFSYYLFRLYLPTSLLVMLTWATFWIPGKAVPARVTLVVTNFLSTMFILQSSASHIPKVTYTTALEVYLFTNVLFIIGVMLEYMVVLNYCPKRKDTPDDKETIQETKFHEQIVLMTQNGTESNCSKSKRKDQGCLDRCTIFRRFIRKDCHVVDGISRFIFPLIYGLFLMTYFSYFFGKVSKLK